MSNNTIQYIINIVGNAQDKINNINRSVSEANTTVNKFQANITKLRDNVIAFEGLSMQADRLGSMFGQVFSVGMENELQKQNLTTLLGGDIDASDTLFGKISEYGKNTVYDKAGLIEAQKTMMSFGIEGEKAFSVLKNIGDISMGDSQKMQSLALAFSQTTSTGKLMGQDLLQMINAGFNPLQVISDKTGKSMSVLKDEMRKGAISADMVAQAFQWATEEGALFYQGAEKAGQTTAGKLNQFKDSITELAIKLFDVLRPAINTVMEKATSLVNFIDNHKKVFIGIGVTLLGLVVLVKSLAVAVAIYNSVAIIVSASTAMWAMVQTALNFAMAMNPITWVILAIVALIAVIAVVVSKINGWGTLWKGIVGFMKYSFFAFVDAIKLYFNTYINGFLIGLDKIKIGWYKFKEATGLGDSSENQRAIAKINADVEARQKAIVDGAKKVADNAEKAKKALGGINLSWESKKSTPSLVEKVKSKLGTNDKLINAVSGNNGSNKLDLAGGNGGKSTTNAIASGGTRNTNIHISIKSMIESLVMQGNTGENAQEIERNMAEAFYRMLNMANVSV